MKGIYLAAFKVLHPNYNITYQDINGKRDIAGDMLDINLNDYDFVIASPPCNYWSRANYRRETSEYSQKTKHLLPTILNKLIALNKPFIVENVINRKLFKKYGLYNVDCFIYEHGRHTYWTNKMINFLGVKQYKEDITNMPSNKRQGGINVHNVIEYWLELIHDK